MHRLLVAVMVAFIGSIALTAFMTADPQVATAHGVPGCPPAKHRVWKQTPVDGGKVLRVVKGPAILHIYWNNDHPDVINEWWRRFVPWGQEQKKVFIPRNQKYEILGAAGEIWKFRSKWACQHLAKKHDIKNGSHLKRVWPWKFRQLGLFRRVGY